MTTMTAGGRVPEFTLGWRMRLALETGGLSVQEMAERLGYSRSTISRWLNDQDEPRPVIIDQWCLVTEVDADWLRTGAGGPGGPEGPGSGAGDKLARLTATKRRGRSSGTGGTARYPMPVLVAA